VTESYNKAAKDCKQKVERIVKECRCTNQKYFDSDFVIDLTPRNYTNSLFSLDKHHWKFWKPNPKSAKRVGDMFDDPKFFISGATSNDILQGWVGNCWLMSSLCAMGNQPGLIDKVCVARDEAVGVYGFLFYRNGEWITEIIDDKLFLKMPDFNSSKKERDLLADVDKDKDEEITSEEAYRKLYQVYSPS
jgi:hypothetical protein